MLLWFRNIVFFSFSLSLSFFFLFFLPSSLYTNIIRLLFWAVLCILFYPLCHQHSLLVLRFLRFLVAMNTLVSAVFDRVVRDRNRSSHDPNHPSWYHLHHLYVNGKNVSFWCFSLSSKFVPTLSSVSNELCHVLECLDFDYRRIQHWSGCLLCLVRGTFCLSFPPCFLLTAWIRLVWFRVL